MSQATPDLQTTNPPKLETVLAALQRKIFLNMNCVRVGVIQSFNASNQTANIQIAQQQVTSTSPVGVRTTDVYPLLSNVPVLFPGGGGVTLTFPIAAGDECILLFNDRDLDAWFVSGDNLPPNTARAHDFSDALAIVGLHNSTRSLPNVSTTGAQLRTQDGSTFVEIDSATQAVKVHAGTVYEWDVHGYGQKITWTGGLNWTIDNYTLGAIVTTNNHAVSPPGPP